MTGEELRQHRKTLKLSQDALAQLLAVHRLTVVNWENEKYPIDTTTALAIEFLVSRRRRERKR